MAGAFSSATGSLWSRDFLMGAATGAIVSLANHWLHGGFGKRKADFSKIKTIKNVLKGYDYVTFRDGGYVCGKAARIQNNKVKGSNPVYDQQQTPIYLKSSENSNLTLRIQEGINIVIENLIFGKPVMAGVMYDMYKNTGNLNDATNHYINIVGMGIENGKYYFSYYDNYGSNGTNTVMNRLYWNGNYFYDSTNISTYSSTTRNFILTEIRQNQ